MLTDFVFDFEFENEKVLVGRHKLVNPIFGAKYVQLIGFSSFFSYFVVTCDLVDAFLSNNEYNKGEPVLGMSVGVIGEYPLIPISRDPINDITVRMFQYEGEKLSTSRIPHIRLLLRIFYVVPSSLLEMKQTVLFLRLERSSNRMSVNYRFPKPLHGVKWIRVLSWNAGSTYAFVMCPILADPCWGNEVDMPLLGFGPSGWSKMREAKRVAEQHSTMNSLVIKMVKPNNEPFSQDYALIHLVIFHE